MATTKKKQKFHKKLSSNLLLLISMNDILKDIETAEQQTYNTIKIITNLQDTIAKFGQDDEMSDELSQFENETEYLKKLAQKVANGLTPPAPKSSSITLGAKFLKVKSNANSNGSCPKFIKAKPKQSKDTHEKFHICKCDKRSSKSPESALKLKNQSPAKTQSLLKSKKLKTTINVDRHACSNLLFLKNEPSLQPTKYLQHFLIPIGSVKVAQSMPNACKTKKSIITSVSGKNKNDDDPYTGTLNKLYLSSKNKSEEIRTNTNLTKLLELCMNVKEERESELEKQVHNLEEEMQAVIESNKSLYYALEKLEEQNDKRKLLRLSSTNTNADTDLTTFSNTDNVTDIPMDTSLNVQENITNDFTEDILKSIHDDIQEITTNITKTRSGNRYIFHTDDKSKTKSSVGLGHVSFLENAILSMENKLETAQKEQVELEIQSKAIVETAHRMSNEPWSYSA